MKRFIVTGIGTDIGKTVVSAILVEALQAAYWKPVQAGDLENSDSTKIKKWCSESIQILPEAFRLTAPVSPHLAASIDNLNISTDYLKIPELEGDLIIEGAGGILVPLNNEGLLFIDVVKYWDLPVILVSRHYLGSINHTLLTAEILKNNNIKVEGIVFVGDENKATEEIILKKTGLPLIARIPLVKEINKEFIQKEANRISSKI
jgi:dethiobiotin synthetase